MPEYEASGRRPFSRIGANEAKGKVESAVAELRKRRVKMTIARGARRTIGTLTL